MAGSTAATAVAVPAAVGAGTIEVVALTASTAMGSAGAEPPDAIASEAALADGVGALATARAAITAPRGAVIVSSDVAAGAVAAPEGDAAGTPRPCKNVCVFRSGRGRPVSLVRVLVGPEIY